MSISRRAFLKVGTIMSIAAGVSMRPKLVFGQDPTNQLGMPAQNDPLAYYTMAAFTPYVNSVFTLRGARTVAVTLKQVQDTLPANTSRAGGRESFVLIFRGGSKKLPQDTYIVEHPALGTFKLFVVPGRGDEKGSQDYVATINRLG